MLDLHKEESVQKLKRFTRVVGIDEVGRGCWAGPLVMAAVEIQLPFVNSAILIDSVRDSKKLTRAKRETVFAELMTRLEVTDPLAFNIHLVEASPGIISSAGLGSAILTSLDSLISKFPTEETYFLSDAGLPWKRLAETGRRFAYESIVKGDDQVYSIALASIYAKVYRDRIMHELASTYPEYGFERNVGYGTAEHRNALQEHGVSPIHRMNYKPIESLLGSKN